MDTGEKIKLFSTKAYLNWKAEFGDYSGDKYKRVCKDVGPYEGEAEQGYDL